MGSNPTPSATSNLAGRVRRDAINTMPGLGAETSVPEEVLAGWRSEVGHRAEENFESATGKLGMEILKEKPDAQKAERLVKEGRIAVLRATPTEDFEKGIDFHIFNPLTGKLVPLDISISNNSEVHAKKRERERREGIRFLPFSGRSLELASRGSERDLEELGRSVNVLLLEDALEQARKGQLQFPQTKVERIERRLQEMGAAA